MKHNPFSLENKTILVTGASSGIGRTIAIECSKMGASLVINGRDSTRLNDTFNHLEGFNHLQISADLQNMDQSNLLIEKLPILDGIVHSAGKLTTLPFQFLTKDKLDDIFSINLFVPSLISKQIIKQNKIKKGASIVWISSIAGNSSVWYGNSIYSSSKSAVDGMVKSMALELSTKDIRVNSINPAIIETPLSSKDVFTQEQIQEEVKKYPLKRYGKPEDVAYACIYLLSDASSWITGSHLLLDGGYTLL